MQIKKYPLVFKKDLDFYTSKNLTNLEFVNNQLQQLTESSFKFTKKLKLLDLSFNNLQKLNNSQFDLLSDLQTLNLSTNKIETLHEQSFNNLRNLNILDLSNNRLTNLNNAINLIVNLNILVLNNNWQLNDDKIRIVTNSYLLQLHLVNLNLKTVPKSIMTRSIVHLNLSTNRIRLLNEEDFDSVPLLRILDLSQNHIETIELDSLSRLELLEELYLEQNAIRTITAPSFSFDLRIIDFSYNNLSSIALFNLEKLEKLDLSWNPIKKLPENLLINLRNLKELNLAGLMTNQSLIPVPDSDMLEKLDLHSSPFLIKEFLENEAIQIAFKSLIKLDLTNDAIGNHQSQSFNNWLQSPIMLFEYLSQLKYFRLDGNSIKCDPRNFTELVTWLESRAENKKELLCEISETKTLVPLIEYYTKTEQNDTSRATEVLSIVRNQDGKSMAIFTIYHKTFTIFLILMVFSVVYVLHTLTLQSKKWLDGFFKPNQELCVHLNEFNDLW